MYVYFDQNGTLKEIISDKKFRVGDSKRDKIYVYWEGEHAPVSGWVKYRKPNGKDYPVSVEECFFQLGQELVGKTLPNKPLRNLKYFSYDHTYEENGETHAGYKFYEITIPDAILNSAIEDEEVPTENNMIVARIRFVMDDGQTPNQVDEADSIETMGALVFSVETNIGILTDSSINETQYNYLVSLISMKIGYGTRSEKVASLPQVGSLNVIYYVEQGEGGIIYDAYIWNGSHYVFLGTTSYGIYSKKDGEDFENAVRVMLAAEMSQFTGVVNEELAAMNTAISNIVSGSPKGVYATLSALQTAYPTGTTGIYVVSENGHWYYWNGSAWTDGGLYNSTAFETDKTLTVSGAAADAKVVGELKSDIDEIEMFKEHSVSTGKMVSASNGEYVASTPYNAHEYLVYGLSVIYLTPYFTNATYGYAFYDKSKNFIANSGGTYDVATRTEITVPNSAYYIRFTENTTASKPKLEADWGLTLETKADIKETKDHSAELYADVYNVTNYIPTDGLAVVGKYYDINGTLQAASNLSTTGIIEVPFGIKDIYYNAYRNPDIPTMLFFDADMQIVGTVIATVAPGYGDEYYSGYAEIPSTAKYMESSMLNTKADQIVTVRYSKVDNNLDRIKKLEKDPLAGLKITCTGNSITAATHSVPGHGYVEQIADAHGMTVDNHAIWGAIIPQGHPRASGDVTDIGCIHDTLDSMDADADIVIMSGSINDCEYYSDASFLGEITGDFSSELDLTTFYGALEDMCKKALQRWAGKPIIYVIEHRMTLDNTIYGQYYLKLHEAIVKVMNKWGVSIVDLFNDCPSLNYNEGYKTKYTTGDGTHPNYEGYERFYVPRVYAEIKKLLGI